MGAVYDAADTTLGGRPVAIKEMHEESLSSKEIAEATNAFHQEAHLLARLQHPNLPRIYDYFAYDGRWYLVMDFIDGETLEDYLQLYGTPGLSVDEVLPLADQICAVLEYLHAQVPPIIFRDLTPSNIMRTPDGEVYLIDFGIARIFKPGKSRDTVAMGKVGYAPPEQLGKAQTTVRSDIFSFGVTLHQLLTGIDPSIRPFTFAPIQPVNPQTPPRLEALIRWMVQMDEGMRPVDIAVIRHELDEMTSHAISQPPMAPQQYPMQSATGLPVYSIPPSPVAPSYSKTNTPARRASSRTWWIVVTVATVLVLFCIAATWAVAANGLGQVASTSATLAPLPTIPPAPTVNSQNLATFQSSQTYTYNVLIGYSITTALTNSDVSVTVQSLTVNGDGGGSLLVVGFLDNDTQEGTNFAFHTLAHVYLTDNAGNTVPGHQC